METFGERLKYEREQRGLAIEAVSAAVGLDRDRLLALERNDFATLPDETIMAGCLRAYAECLDVDADLMIDDYMREREKCLTWLSNAVTERAAEIAPPAMRSHAAARPRYPRSLLLSLIVGALILLGALWLFVGRATAPVPESPRADAPAGGPATPSQAQADVSPQPPAPGQERADLVPAPVAAPPPVELAAPPVASASHLSVSDHAVGVAVRERELVGKRDRFREGTEVWFWTLIEGGSDGDRVEHVWLHEGVEAARISLNVGGPRWRTYSSKALRSTGRWTVEARDADGRLLARSDFTCRR